MTDNDGRPCIERHILSECISREMSVPSVFTCYNDAWNEMERRYEEVTDGEEDNGEISAYSAFAETKNHDDIDWQIHSIKVYLTDNEIKALTE